MEGCRQAPPRFPPPGVILSTPPARPALLPAVQAGPHSPHRAVGSRPHGVEGRVSPGQLPEGPVHLLSVKASSPCDVHRPAGAGLPPPQSTGVREGFWGETGTARPPALVKKSSSEFPSLFSAVASVKGHVFGPSSLRLHIGGGEASGFPTRLGPVQVPLDSGTGASTQPRGRHTSGSPAVTCSFCCPASTGPPAKKCPRGARRGSREIPALNKRMSKDWWSQGIWGTSHSASSDKQGHSSFQLMEDSSRLVTKDTRVLHPHKSKEAMGIFSQARLPSRAGTW